LFAARFFWRYILERVNISHVKEHGK